MVLVLMLIAILVALLLNEMRCFLDITPITHFMSEVCAVPKPGQLLTVN